MLTSSFIAVASLLLSYFPLAEKVEYSIAEISIAKKASLVFSIGQMEVHKAGGNLQPLGLMKTPDDFKVMMVSEPFTASGGDSIYFRRLLSIQGAGFKKANDKNIYAGSFEKAYQSLEASYKKGVKLHDTLFNKESSIMFITDLMYQNDSTIIASLDTITVKQNADGYLRAYTAPYRPEAVTKKLGEIHPSRPLVLRVWMHMILPEKSKFAIKTNSQLRDKKAYNMISVNPSMVVPGYSRKN